MKINKKATSIAEAMVLMLIVVSWVTWMYKVYMSSINLERSTNYKIAAMNIAREWTEAITSIRNTNWLLFSSDTKNCWNTLDYESNCVWNNSSTTDIGTWSYKIFKNTEDRWMLTWAINTSWYTDSDYRNDMMVWIDLNWFYTQTWIINNLKPIFTREIKINYTDIDWNITWNSEDQKMEIKSLVQWQDSASKQPHEVELIQILSNWEK